MRRALVVLLVAGCGPQIADAGGTGSAGTDGGSSPTDTNTNTNTSASDASSADASTTAPGTTTAATTVADTSTGTSSTDSDVDTSDFIQPPDVPPHPCDVFAQDCARGFKCVPVGPEGSGYWDFDACVPIDPDAVGVGEACTVQGWPTSGLDDCDVGSWCFDVDPVTLTGQCYALCVGSPAMPLCEDPASTCFLSGSRVIAVCLPTCNPLAPTCVDGQGCYPGFDGSFYCFDDASGAGGAPGDACETAEACDPGNACIPANTVPGCDDAAGSCCSDLCDLDAPDECPALLPGTVCTPWWAPGRAPPGPWQASVGVCASP